MVRTCQLINPIHSRQLVSACNLTYTPTILTHIYFNDAFHSQFYERTSLQDQNGMQKNVLNGSWDRLHYQTNRQTEWELTLSWRSQILGWRCESLWLSITFICVPTNMSRPNLLFRPNSQNALQILSGITTLTAHMHMHSIYFSVLLISIRSALFSILKVRRPFVSFSGWLAVN